MSKTSIKVQYVNQPKSPKGPGSVKTDTGVYYKVWKDLLPQFESGKTYEIEFDTEQYNGSDRFIARKILSSSESTNGSNGSPASVGTFVQPDSNRSARIERQAALKVAVQLLATEVQMGRFDSDAGSLLDRLFEFTDEIVLHIANDGTKTTAPVEQEVEI